MNRNQRENAFKMSVFFVENKIQSKKGNIYIHTYIYINFNLYVHDYYYYALYIHIDYSGFYTVVYLI